jgi:hypothetical protein
MKTQEEIENEDKCMLCEVTEGTRLKEFLKVVKRLTKAMNETEYKDLNDFLFSFSAVLTFVGFNVREHKLEYMEEAFVKVLTASIRGTTPDKVMFPKVYDKKNERSDVMYG